MCLNHPDVCDVLFKNRKRMDRIEEETKEGQEQGDQVDEAERNSYNDDVLNDYYLKEDPRDYFKNY